MNFDTIQTQYGRKLLVTFEYDEETVERIKELDWETTHRSWNPEHEGWTVDLTEHSIREFQNHMGMLVPPEHIPWTDEKPGTVTFRIPDGYTWFFIDNAPEDVSQMLDQELSYEDPNAQYTSAYKRGEWDGIVRLYDTGSDGAPIGLLDRAIDIVEEMGYSTDIHRIGDRSGEPVKLNWEFDHELRGYQRNAMDAVMEQGGGIVALPTGTGKTVTFLAIEYAIGQKAIVLVHTKELLYQWADEVRNVLGVEPGMIGDGEWSEGPVTIAIIQTLMSRGTSQLSGDYGVLCFDECHRTSAADVMHDIGMDIDAEWRIGLSATPWRRVSGEELKIEGATGGEAYTATAEEMIDEGYISRPEFLTVDPEEYGDITWSNHREEYADAYRRVIEMNPARNTAVADTAAELVDRGYKVLVNVDRIGQGKILESALNVTVGDIDGITDVARRREVAEAADRVGQVADLDAVFLSGGDSSDRREAVIDEFENGELDVMISTILQEGVDIPDINAIVLAQGGKSDIQQIQTIGRALRQSNGDSAVIVDFEDRGRWFRDHFRQRQAVMAEYYGEYGPDAEPVEDDDDEKIGTIDLTGDPPDFEELFGDE